MRFKSGIWCSCAILYMALIWYLSSLERPMGDITLPFPHADKLIHFVEFSVLAYLWFQGFQEKGKKKAALFSALITIFWGILDECHQSVVPGRNASVVDASFDILGALVVSSWLGLK